MGKPKKKQSIKKMQNLQRREIAQKRRARKARFKQQESKNRWGDEGWNRAFSNFSTQLHSLGLRIKDVSGDGNCLFRAIADQIEGNNEAHMKYRLGIVRYVENHRDDFEPFIEDDIPFDTHIRNMKKDRTWGGNIEIQAAAQLYQINITIHQHNQPLWQIRPFPGNRTIHLSYHNGNHFSSVRKIGDSDVGIPSPIELSFDEPSRGGSSSKDSKNEEEEETIQFPTENERIIIESTCCTDIKLVRQTYYLECDGDMSKTIAIILGKMPPMDDSSYLRTETFLEELDRKKEERDRRLEAEADEEEEEEEEEDEEEKESDEERSTHSKGKEKVDEKEKEKEESDVILPSQDDIQQYYAQMLSKQPQSDTQNINNTDNIMPPSTCTSENGNKEDEEKERQRKREEEEEACNTLIAQLLAEEERAARKNRPSTTSATMEESKQQKKASIDDAYDDAARRRQEIEEEEAASQRLIAQLMADEALARRLMEEEERIISQRHNTSQQQTQPVAISHKQKRKTRGHPQSSPPTQSKVDEHEYQHSAVEQQQQGGGGGGKGGKGEGDKKGSAKWQRQRQALAEKRKQGNKKKGDEITPKERLDQLRNKSRLSNKERKEMAMLAKIVLPDEDEEPEEEFDDTDAENGRRTGVSSIGI